MVDMVDSASGWAYDRDREVHFGAVCIKGTRFPLHRLIADLADGMSLDEIIEDFDLPRENTITALKNLSINISYWNDPGR